MTQVRVLALSRSWGEEVGSDACLRIGGWMTAQMLHRGCLTEGYFGPPVMLPKVLAINNKNKDTSTKVGPKLAEIQGETLETIPRFHLYRCFFILCRFSLAYL